jgi:hypothetical protein
MTNPFRSIPRTNSLMTRVFVAVAGIGFITGCDASTIFDSLVIAGFIIFIAACLLDGDGTDGPPPVSPGIFMAIAAEVSLFIPFLIRLGNHDFTTMAVGLAPIVAVALICVVAAAYVARSAGDRAPMALLMLEAIPVLGRVASWVRYWGNGLRLANS